ncbi:MAG TPA: sulfite exporter TauE/SafE family protein [Terriglobia bacterium]|nr:sulfite exporter TauE/SafE family protein [Terriglobia bacterium]
MDIKLAFLGFVVGILVGLTGMGGGAVMTPMLILLGWAKPVIAVGTDLVWSSITKAFGAFVHYRQQTVDFKIVRRLVLGSIPGALVGLALLAYLRIQGGDAMDKLVVRMLGVALMSVALTLLFRTFRGSSAHTRSELAVCNGPQWVTSVLGAVVGFLVSLTSVGSGSLIIACLIANYPGTPLKRIVGSDIVHALFLVGISALGHMGIVSINVSLLAGLLIGSVPGVWIGSKMSAHFPEKILRPVLGTTLLFLGYKLL